MKHKALEQHRPIVTDETWIFSKCGNLKSWQGGTATALSRKTNMGVDTYIIVHDGNTDGFIDEASLIFKSNSKNGAVTAVWKTLPMRSWTKMKLMEWFKFHS